MGEEDAELVEELDITFEELEDLVVCEVELWLLTELVEVGDCEECDEDPVDELAEFVLWEADEVCLLTELDES